MLHASAKFCRCGKNRLKSVRNVAIACDLGTTTLAASLVALDTGERLALVGSRNPQIEFGADVVARLEAALRSEEARQEMKRLANRELERLVDDLMGPFEGQRPAAIAIAGNPAMEHLLLGLPLEKLAFPPHRPLFSGLRREKGFRLGWRSDHDLLLLPLPGGFVGGDLVAFLYGLEPQVQGKTVLCLDIGTNGEIALIHRGGISATSAAAGPALEGGSLSCGMPAGSGAVSRIHLEGETLRLSTIGGGAPLGICGSAAVDVVAALLDAGVIDGSGRLVAAEEVSTNLASRIVDDTKTRRFVIYRDALRTVALTQEDIRQIQLAKGAVAAGIDVLLDQANLTRDDLEQVVVTGSFGAELDPIALKKIGIFTEKMVKKARFIREGVLAGLERMLSARDGMAAVEELARAIAVIPLSGTPAFEKHFLQHLNFPDR